MCRLLRECKFLFIVHFIFSDFFDQLKEIAVTLKEVNRGPIDYTSLYSEVMAMASDGYSEDILLTGFDHLCENKKAATKGDFWPRMLS